MFSQDMLSHLELGAESVKRPKYLIWYRAGHETGGLHLEEKRASEDLKLTSLLCWLYLSGRIGQWLLR